MHYSFLVSEGLQSDFSPLRGAAHAPLPPTFADQLTLSQPGGRLGTPHYYLPLQIFRPSAIPAMYKAKGWGYQYFVSICVPLFSIPIRILGADRFN